MSNEIDKLRNMNLMRGTNPNDGCQVKNVAFVNYQYQKSGVDGDITSSSTISNISTLDVSPANTISFKMLKLSCTEYTEPEDIISYKVAMVNTGNLPITNSSLKDTLLQTTYINGTGGAEINHVTVPVVDLSFGSNIDLFTSTTIDPGQMLVYKFKVQVSPSAVNSIANLATISVVNPIDGSNLINTDFVVIPNLFAKLVAQKLVYPTIAKCNDAVTYTIAIGNIGNLNAKNVAISDLFESEVCVNYSGIKVLDGGVPLSTNLYSTTLSANNLFTANIATISAYDTISIVIPATICCCK